MFYQGIVFADVLLKDRQLRRDDRKILCVEEELMEWSHKCFKVIYNASDVSKQCPLPFSNDAECMDEV